MANRFLSREPSPSGYARQNTHNQAKGGGSDGPGVGGGVSNRGVFLFDGFTVIKKNHASTRDDEVFSV